LVRIGKPGGLAHLRDGQRGADEEVAGLAHLPAEDVCRGGYVKVALKKVEYVRPAPAEDRGELLHRGCIPKATIDVDEQSEQLLGVP
jgi:hypothetical protein